jgi:hypothetical protein
MTVYDNVVVSEGGFVTNAWKTRHFRLCYPDCQRLRFRYRSIDFHPLGTGTGLGVQEPMMSGSYLDEPVLLVKAMAGVSLCG